MKRKLTLLLTTLILMYMGDLTAQCNFEIPSPPGPSCQEAAFFCDGEINNYCSTLGGTNGAVPSPLCPGGGVPNNIAWIAFAAGTPTISISVTPSNCQAQGNQVGVQAGIYGDCPAAGGASPTNSIVCNPNCMTNQFTLTSTAFVVGQVYYLFIDGCAGDICDYTLDVTAGSTVSPGPGFITPPVGPLVTCQGQTGITYEILPPGTNVSNYNWTLPPGATYVETNGVGSQISVDFGTQSGQICVEASNDCFPSAQGPVCIDVQVLPPPTGTLVDTYCTGSVYNYYGTDYTVGNYSITLTQASFQGCDSIVDLTLTEYQLPPFDVYESYCQADGFYNYPGDGGDYSAGDYMITFPSASFQGCDSIVNLHVTEYLATELILEIAICSGEEYEVCYNPLDQQGNYAIDCSPNYHTCDSTIIVDLIVLEPYSDILPPEVLGCGINESIYLDGFNSFGTEFIWTTVDGDICGDETSLFVQVCLPGTYCLEATETITTVDQGLVTCTDQSCVVVTSNSTPPATSYVSTDISCPGDIDGTATVSVSNPAIGPFSYDWSPNTADFTNSVTGLSAGTYMVTVTGMANGCSSIETIVITEPTAITIATSQTDLGCNGGTNGTATATPSGGTSPFTYSWCNGQTTATATGLPVGPCIVVVTDDSGCSETTSVTIIEPVVVTATITPMNVTCNGTSTGSATANPAGGTSPYTYMWCNGQTTQTATGLPAGPCTVVISDLNNCSITESVDLIEPEAMSLTTDQTNVLCNGDMNGTAIVMPMGGVGPYTYNWCNSQVSQTATGLGVGVCSVVVTDNNGCTQMTSVDLTAPNAMTLTTSQTNVLCAGGTDGTATAMPDGGTEPFSYSWCNGQTAPTATGLGVGTCNVVVTDANGCTQMQTVDLTAPTALVIQTAQTDVLCNGGNDGTGTATPDGGTGPYTYQWCNGQTGATATGLGTGPCQVIVTDDNGCSETSSVNIAEATSITIALSSTDVLCNGESNGTGTATPDGGTGPYTYLWCNGEDTAIATGLSAGPCVVVVTDANGCSETESVTLDEPGVVNVSASGTDLSCAGANDGTATAVGSGGNGTITYEWCDGQTTETATGLPAGPCTVIATDANGCSVTTSVDLDEPVALLLDVSSEDVTCFGASNGTATVTPSGGTGTYSYMWCNGQGTSTATGLGVGPCAVVVTDNNGCSETISVDLDQPASALELNATSTDASCGVDNGTISLTVNGGTGPYSYDWSGSADDVQNPEDLGPGNYTVTVTDDNDCTETFTVGVDTPTGLDAVAAWTDVSCSGGNNGTIDVTVNGGTGPYEYTWDSPLIPTDSPTGVDLPADDYNVTVSDADGCTFVTSATVDQPEVIVIDGNATDETCGESNGTISISVQGGTGPYSYSWDNGDTTGDIEDLPAGNYVLDLTDANGCTANFGIAVSTPNQLELSDSFIDVSCNGGTNGSIDLEVSGGVAPFTYDWDNAGPVQDPDNLAAGTYIVIVTDDTGCSVTTQVEISEPTPVSAVNLVQQATCGDDNGGVSITASGGTAPYDYLWSNGNMTDSPTGLAPDTYTVTVTDDNGCSIVEVVEVDTPPAISLNVSSVMTSCFQGTDGSIDLEVNGGTSPFTYVWSNTSIDQDPTALAPGMYTVVVTDANGCTEETGIMVGEPTEIEIGGSATNATCGETNGTASVSVQGGTTPYTYSWTGTPSTDANPTDLGPGNYCVVVTDANGCTNDFCIDVETPDGLLLQADAIPVNCFGDATGSIDLEVMGGVGPFTYEWDNTSTDQDLTDLPAGIYEVVVTDTETGCTIVTSATIDQPEAILISGNANPATCGNANGSVGLTVSGGTGPYGYAWSPGGYTDQSPIDLPADDYSVIVTDANGCTADFAITVDTPVELTSSATSTDASCNGGSDGGGLLTVAGGTGPFTYQWSNGSTEQNPVDFMAGNFTGTVTDANGCTSEVAIEVAQPEALGVTSTETDETCGELNGTISLAVTGGTAPFSYNWTQGLGDTPTPIDLAAGNYDVVITDANGCTIDFATAVSTPNELLLSAAVTNANCNLEVNGFIDITITGGVAPFTQVWDDPGAWTGEDLADVPAGTYTVIVTDATDCSVILTETVTEPTMIEIDGTSTEALCNQSNGTIDINVNGGTGAYSYLWTPGDLDVEDPTGLGIGSYTVVVTDANGCTGTFEIGVETPSGLALTPTAIAANCNGASDGAVNLVVSGGTAPFVFDWDNGAVTPELMNVAAGTYNVLVTDADGCTIVASAIVDEPDPVVVTGNPTDETCNLSNGTITTAVIGGTGPYTYAWSPSGSTDPSPVGLAAMVHTVVVTDANGCTGTNAITVDAPNALAGSLNPTNVSCDNGTDGEISAAIFGGNGPYTYQWTPMGGTDATATNLPAGDYSVEVIDNDGCILNLPVTLTSPSAITISGTSLDATCGETNGSIDLTVDGGVMPYNYAWNQTAGNTPDPGNLGAGSYIVTVTDANNCTLEFDINVNTPNMLELTATPADATCNGLANGSISTLVTGGVGPFTYLLMPGGIIVDNPTDLAAGTYTMAVTDATDCTVTTTIEINQPDAILITDVVTSATCNQSNGTADITVTGGTTPYSFEWSTGSMLEDPTDFGAGGHIVTVTDANGCTETHGIDIEIPDQPAVEIVVNDVDCFGASSGSIDVTVTGGIGPFTFNWSPGGASEDLVNITAGSYDLELIDGLGCIFNFAENVDQPVELVASIIGPSSISCNGSSDGSANLDVIGGTGPYTYLWSPSGEVVQNPTNLAAGNNTVVVTDANGCTTTDMVAMTEPDELTLSYEQVMTDCFGSSDGSIDLTVNGGTLPYTYAWSNADTNEDPGGLAAGAYVVVVTDDNGCTGILNTTVEQPAAVEVFITDVSTYGIFNLSCESSEDGSASATVTGGNGPFTYQWDNGTTGGTLSNVGAGTYTVVATDANGCSGTSQVSLIAPDGVFAAYSVEDLVCYGDTDGAIFLDNVDGGSEPYQFSLDGGALSQVGLFGNLSGGQYEVMVQDANGCTSTQSVTIDEPSELAISLGDDFEIQLGDDPFDIEAIANVVAIDSTYLQYWEWTQGRFFTQDTCSVCPLQEVNPLETTLYEFLMIDTSGCIAIDDLLITVIKEREVYIPNVFSPNGDGVNDLFYIQSSQELEIVKTFKIYNRWGEVVYELSDFFANDPSLGWDGSLNGEALNQAVFVYFAEVEFKDGRIEILQGDVTLLR